MRTQLITISYVIHTIPIRILLNPYGIYTIAIINNFMEQFKHLNLSGLRHIKDRILHTPFHIGWVFAVLITGMAVCIYALSQLV